MEVWLSFRIYVLRGLMTVPPFRENLEHVRPYFRELRELKDQLNALSLPNVS